MTSQPFAIYDFRTGVDLSVAAWKAPSDAFIEMDNCYLRRGSLNKRYGQSVFGQIGKFVDDEAFDTGDGGKTYTHTAAQTPVIPGSLSVTDAVTAQTIYWTKENGSEGDGTITVNFTTWVIDVVFDVVIGIGDPITCDYHYEVDEACRGIFTFDRYNSVNELIAVQEKRVSVWDVTYKYFRNIDDGAGNYDHFSSLNLVSTASKNDILWFLTNEASDGIWTYDGTSMTNQTLAGQMDLNAGGTEDIKTGLHLFSHKSRMLILSPTEGAGAGTLFPQRLRWSWVGDALVSGAWQDDIAGRGGYVDADTNYEILDVKFLGNTPIVFFEKGVWAIDYTGDPILPFVWRQISSIHQISATHSSITYDKYVTAVGGKDLIASDVNNAFIYNKKVPEITFDFDTDNLQYCYGYRDDRFEQGLISYAAAPDSVPNNKILVYNYEDNNFAKFTLNSKCFGEWTEDLDRTFDSYGTDTFDDHPTVRWGDRTLQAGYPIILSGWTKGYIYEINDEDTGLDADDWEEQLEQSAEEPQPYNFGARTVRVNPFVEEGKQAVLDRIEIFVDKNENAEFTVGLYSGTNDYEYLTKTITCEDQGTGEDMVVKVINVDHQSTFHSLRFYLTDAQLAKTSAQEQRIVIQGIIFWMIDGEDMI